jgi:alcohol dehydrogenase (NADP+)
MEATELRSGDRMPALGLGTWKSDPGVVGDAVYTAVSLGYRHFDCASIYGNEAEIGGALERCIAGGMVSRDELWITSKLWNDSHASEDVVPALKQTLADLRLEYLDLYLVHWPVALRKGVFFPQRPEDLIGLDQLPLAETWSGMERAAEQGLCRHIGVSNFSAPKLAALMEGARIAPEIDQVELHPYLQQTELVGWCREHDLAVTAYSPLGSRDRPAALKASDEPDLFQDPKLVAIAERTGVTPAHVLIAWAVRRGTSVIPKSVNPERMAQNLEAASLPLSEADMQAIGRLDRGRRYVTGSFWAMAGSPYTVAGLWDA